MIVVFLGFTFLLATIFPLGNLIAQISTGGLGGPIFGHVPPIFSLLLVLLLSYVPAAIASYIFIRKANLANRLPRPSPGRSLLLIGVILILAYLSVRLFASTIQGGGAGFVVMSFAPFVIIPANICLVIGVVKLLLSARADVSYLVGADAPQA